MITIYKIYNIRVQTHIACIPCVLYLIIYYMHVIMIIIKQTGVRDLASQLMISFTAWEVRIFLLSGRSLICYIFMELQHLRMLLQARFIALTWG